MKMNELKLVYFSPTGTTRKVIMEVAKGIDLKSVSFNLTVPKEKKPSLQFKKEDFVLFGVPVYSGRVPRTFLEYFDLLKGEDTPAALIATYGCREYEDALLELQTEVEKRGFKVIGAAAFPTEHSIIRSIGSGRPNKDDMKVIADFGIQLNRRIKQENSFEEFHIQVPGNTPYRKYGHVSLHPRTNRNLCTECGACVKACPSGAIPAENPKKTNTKSCISCLKCVRVCKQKARTVNSLKISLTNRRLRKVCQSSKTADIFV